MTINRRRKLTGMNRISRIKAQLQQRDLRC
jgi:hypothetical protein